MSLHGESSAAAGRASQAATWALLRHALVLPVLIALSLAIGTFLAGAPPRLLLQEPRFLLQPFTGIPQLAAVVFLVIWVPMLARLLRALSHPAPVGEKRTTGDVDWDDPAERTLELPVEDPAGWSSVQREEAARVLGVPAGAARAGGQQWEAMYRRAVTARAAGSSGH